MTEWRAVWDHPRVRGEHEAQRNSADGNLGPSPRARGAQGAHLHHAFEEGTIPACAGSTHPHLVRAGDELHEGPSPRARGAQDAPPPHAALAGTIPACAGSTTSWTSRHGRGWDHPRVRGEHTILGAGSSSPQGPSPRARGAHQAPVLARGRAGTIPACAGSTSGPPPRSMSAGDHPRVRGEHHQRATVCCIALGPSPRARGAQRFRLGYVGEAGTIPACAGSTRPIGGRPAEVRDHPRVRGEHTA